MAEERSPQGRKNLHATTHRPPNTTAPRFRSMRLSLQFFPKFRAHLAIELLLQTGVHRPLKDFLTRRLRCYALKDFMRSS
jgi:hypothetical protein